MPSETLDSQVGDLLRQAVERVGSQADGPRMIDEATAKSILAAAGIDVPAGRTGADPELLLADLTGPFVLKAVSPTLIHKSDAGGVAVGLAADEVHAAARTMRETVSAAGHEVSAFLLEEMAAGPHEVVVGAVRNPGVGWVVMVGLGGVFVEVLQDVAFGVAPLVRPQIVEMIDELRGLPLLQGARGSEPADLDALVELIEALAGPGGLLDLMPPQVTEIDLNPIKLGAHGAVAVDARFVVDPAATLTTDRTRTPVPPTDFSALFEPKAVAVLGASTRAVNAANLFVRHLQTSGFSGRIVPVHPKADEVEGIATVPSLADAGAIDYAFVALPGAKVAEALSRTVDGVAFAQVVSSGFAEVAGGELLERELVESARRQGTRIIGPNSLGTHTSRGGVGFIADAPYEPGGVAVVSQSGGLSVDILRLGSASGVRFHSVTSIGNSADVTPAEMVGHLLDSPEVRVIGLYLESLERAREVLELVTGDRLVTKPIVLLVGGRSAEGSRAAASHTGALSGNHRLWPALARQARLRLVDSLDDFLSVLLGFDVAKPSVRPSSRDVVLFGNGGGASVLATDALARHGLVTPTLAPEVVAALEAFDLPPGNGLTNPVDVPAGTLAVRSGAVADDILRTILASTEPAVVVTHLNVGIIQRNLEETHGDVTGRIIETVARLQAETETTHHLLVLKGDGKSDMEERIGEYARRARSLGVAAHRQFEAAAISAAALLAEPAPTTSPQENV
ncbi:MULTISPECIES: acetate--CoA ligase family protein [Aeromicrobium]|uniref:acetate--CoA ligase family protein n=1 Tax=Aeromicrobium TaxID=2040 RepID=UPI00257D1954|nr:MULTISPECIES: acetate--CoA ligase family protein [Aeromicrobium]